MEIVLNIIEIFVSLLEDPNVQWGAASNEGTKNTENRLAWTVTASCTTGYTLGYK